MRELRMGLHPVVLERQINSELLDNNNRYAELCLRYGQRILRNLRNARQFNGLPTYDQFEQFSLFQSGLARFEMMMYTRFRDFSVVDRYGGDIDIARDIGE